jgi:hypothetical protein
MKKRASASPKRRPTVTDVYDGLLGLHEAMMEGFGKIWGRFAEIDERFDEVDRRFGNLEHTMNKRFDRVDLRFDEFARRVDVLESPT